MTSFLSQLMATYKQAYGVRWYMIFYAEKLVPTLPYRA